MSSELLGFWGKYAITQKSEVMVAEDAEGCQILVQRILKRYGLEVVIVDDGKEAVEKTLGESLDF